MKRKAEDAAIVCARSNMAGILSCLGMVNRLMDPASRKQFDDPARGIRSNFGLIRELASPGGPEAGAMETLRGVYRYRVCSLAEELAPKLKRRVFRGFTATDGEKLTSRRNYRPPLWRLESEIEKRLIPDEAAAGMVAALSPWARVFVQEDEPIGCIALNAALYDVLTWAAKQGWYRSRKGEDPSTAELLGGPRKAAERHAARGIEAAKQWLKRHRALRSAA